MKKEWDTKLEIEYSSNIALERLCQLLHVDISKLLNTVKLQFDPVITKKEGKLNIVSLKITDITFSDIVNKAVEEFLIRAAYSNGQYVVITGDCIEITFSSDFIKNAIHDDWCKEKIKDIIRFLCKSEEGKYLLIPNTIQISFKLI